jgi:hypothetical protein
MLVRGSGELKLIGKPLCEVSPNFRQALLNEGLSKKDLAATCAKLFEVSLRVDSRAKTLR